MRADVATSAPAVPGYLLGERIGRGSCGTVWAATRVRDGASVAIKVVAVGVGGHPESAARELAVLARAAVDGLVGFHEALGLVGEPATVALVLDRVDGGSLERVVRARGHLSVGESVTVLAPVARAVAGLHRLGVVHGDLTPGNVLLERTGRPLVADLGVASLAGEVPGQLYGTVGFVAPEVLDRGIVSTASDVYAVGALAWWCVTGSAPEPLALRRPLEELAPGLPDAWAEVTLKALLVDPDLRPTAAELALAYYDSAPCEPLRLVVGSDETSLLTQRLRQQAPAAAPAGAPRSVPTMAGGMPRDLTRRLGTLAAPLPGLMPRAGRRRVPGRAAVLGTVSLLVAGTGGGGLLVSGRVPTPGWVDRVGHGPGRAANGPQDRATASSAADPTAARPQVAPGRPVQQAEPAARPDAATDPAAPQRDPQGLMVALATLRGQVMMSGSVTGLAGLDAPGSPALAQDTAALRALTESGRSWRGVVLRVISARTVSGGTGRATVDAMVETAAYRVVDASGRAEAQPAVPGQRLRFQLRWSAGRWRVDSIAGTAG